MNAIKSIISARVNSDKKNYTYHQYLKIHQTVLSDRFFVYAPGDTVLQNPQRIHRNLDF